MVRYRTLVTSFALVMLIGLAALDATGSETIRNIPPTAHGAPAGASLEELSQAIGKSAAEMQWFGASDVAGSIVVSTMVREKHRATVEIGFDAMNFWIDYRDSSNLDYASNDRITRTKDKKVVVTKGPRIHKNYNLWVQNLARHIADRTKLLVADRRNQGASATPVLIADELEKLDQLRVRGVLTQQEFDAQKAKLLAQ